MDELTIVIVTFNSADCIERCIGASLLWTSRVVVVDNASTDGTVEVVRGAGAKVIANSENRGFAGGANQGFASADTPYVLLLNPDVTLGQGRDDLIAAASSGAATGLLTDEAGNPQKGFTLRRLPTPLSLSFEALGLNRLFPNNPVNRHWRALDVDLSVPQDAYQPPGAFLLVRREAWAAIGGFDESFWPIWFEDVDFSRRLWEAGFRIRYAPRVRAIHLGAHSIRKMPSGEREVQWYVSLLEYAAKTFGRLGHLAVAVSVALSAGPRAVVAMLRSGRVEHIYVCARVLVSTVKSVFGERSKSVPGRKEPLRAITVENSLETEKTHLHVP